MIAKMTWEMLDTVAVRKMRDTVETIEFDVLTDVRECDMRAG